MKNTYYYIGPNPTVDLALINMEEEKILLILRGNHTNACPDMWAIPGGFINTKAKRNQPWLAGEETPEMAALRELQEETNFPIENLDPDKLILNGIYEGNQRDPRDNEISWSKSHAFYYILNKNQYQLVEQTKGLDDAQDVKSFTFKEIQNTKLAFDHNLIISNMLNELKNNKKLKI